jgi:hypothetical protein
MSLFQRLFGRKPQFDDVLNRCDLKMARDEIVNFHNIVNAQGEAEGGAYLFSKEYVAAWEAFRDSPNTENARTLLDVAPTLLQYFEGCQPGGFLYESNSYFKKRA